MRTAEDAPRVTGVPDLSVVVPTLDEARRLPGLLDGLRALGPGVEWVVVDGGSTDGTPRLAEAAGARVVRSPRGRGVQLRRGAASARGEWLLFLHADVGFDARHADAVRDFLERAPWDRAAHFPFAVAARGVGWRILEGGQRLRERVAGLVYGDQGLLVSRRLYDTAGGHPSWPLMEDVEVVDRVRAHGALERLSPPLPSSPRRYRRSGPVRGWLRNAALLTLFRLGVPPERLLRWYGPEPGEGRGSPPAPSAADDTLVVFAKAPRPGTVKTRLAADVGHAEATRIYRTLGRGVVEGVRRGPWRTVVAFTPADAREEVAAWLDLPDVGFRVQSGGDLGSRMATALEEALAGAPGRACVVGTDAPGVDAARVGRAFQALDDHDVVLGPAEDGGYYLVGVGAPHPGLFRDVPWSTPRVLETTLERARSLGLTVHLLEPLRDVDHLEDVPPELLEP